MSKVLSLRIEDDLKGRLDNLSTITKRPIAVYVREALEEAIERLEYEYSLLKDVEDYRKGHLETYTLDEVRQHCGLANKNH